MSKKSNSQSSQQQIKIKCKHCNSEDCRKHGISHNKNSPSKQRYQCKECGKVFVVGDNRFDLKKYPVKLREQVIRTYLSKTSIRGIEYIFDVHNSLVSKWIKRCSKNIKKMQDKINKSKDPKVIDILEVDELFTYIKKNQ